MTEQEWLTSEDPGAMLRFLTDRPQQPASGTRRNPRHPGDRKLRLFACACVRQVWHLLTDESPCGRCGGKGVMHPRTYCPECNDRGQGASPGRVNRSRRAVEVAERYADTTHTTDEWGSAHNDAVHARVAWAGHLEHFHAARMAELVVLNTPDVPALLREHTLTGGDQAEVRRLQAALLRDVVGNPFRPVLLAPEEPDNVFAALDVLAREASRRGATYVRRAWLTPDVLALARSAYEDRPGRVCDACGGDGRAVKFSRGRPGAAYGMGPCEVCHGSGRIDDGTLDPLTLLAAADALVEAGCPEEVLTPVDLRSTGETVCVAAPHPLLAHLRSPGPHFRGMWSLDLTLNKE